MNIIGTVNASWNIFFQKELSFLSSNVDAFYWDWVVVYFRFGRIHTNAYALDHNTCTVSYMYTRGMGVTDGVNADNGEVVIISQQNILC